MKRYAMVLTLACAVYLVGCGSSNDNKPQTRLRVINALAGANSGPVDVSVGNQQILTSVGTGQESGSVQVNAGTQTINIFQHGTSTLLATGNVNLTANVDQPILVTGITGTTTGTQQAQVVALSAQDLSSTPAQGQSRVYFINAASDVTTVNFSYTPTGGTTVTNADMTNVPYLQMTPAQFPTFGTTTFTATVGSETVNSAPVTLVGTKTYAVVLSGRTTASTGTPVLALNAIQLN